MWICPPWKTQLRGLRSLVSRASKRCRKLAWEILPHGFLAPGNRWEPSGDIGFQSSPNGLFQPTISASKGETEPLHLSHTIHISALSSPLPPCPPTPHLNASHHTPISFSILSAWRLSAVQGGGTGLVHGPATTERCSWSWILEFVNSFLRSTPISHLPSLTSHP